MSRKFGALILLSVLSACSSVSDPQKLALLKYGAVTVHATPAANANGAASTTAIFFEAYSANIPDSRSPLNQCQYAIVDTTTSKSQGGIGAGASINYLIGHGAIFTSTDVQYDVANKRYQASGTVTYGAGDSLRVTVPGEVNGFPASTIAVRLAEPVLPQPIVLPPAGFAMSVKWNASADTTSAMIISIKYANPASSPYPNEQILCSLKDNGSQDFTAAALAPVLASPAAMRSVTLTRWRTQVVTPNPTSLLHVVTSFDTVIKL